MGLAGYWPAYEVRISLGGGIWHKLLDWYWWFMAFPLLWSMAAGTAVAPCLNEPLRDSVALVAQIWSERGWCRRCCWGLQRWSSKFLGGGLSGWWDLCRDYGVQGMVLGWSGLYFSWRVNAPLGLGQHDIYWVALMWKKHLLFLINLHLLMNCQIASVSG